MSKKECFVIGRNPNVSEICDLIAKLSSECKSLDEKHQHAAFILSYMKSNLSFRGSQYKFACILTALLNGSEEKGDDVQHLLTFNGFV